MPKACDLLNLVDNAKPFKSVFRAMEWAESARERGLDANVKAWKRAHDEGWDDEHYDPDKAAKYHADIAAGRPYSK